MANDRWQNASSYDLFMGRWSRSLAGEFLGWLNIAPQMTWLEIGCGTGSLTTAICELADPSIVIACDVTPDFVNYCRENLHYRQLRVVPVPQVGYPNRAGGFDAVVSSLVLNFIPSTAESLANMRNVCSPGGCVAACVWDYSEGMQFLRVFWDAAVDIDPAAQSLDEGRRFPLCRPDALRAAFEAAGLQEITVAPLTVATTFESFDDFWAPFVNGPGPAPTYVAALGDLARHRLAERLRIVLGAAGPITLHARAWAVKGLRGAA
jgi:SAM-dependent methyltransferase